MEQQFDVPLQKQGATLSRTAGRIGVAVALLGGAIGGGWWMLRRPPALTVGEVRLESGDLQGARAVAEQRVKVNPADPGSWRLLAECDRAEGKWLAAARSYGKVVETTAPEERWEPMLMQAIAAQRGGDLASVERLLKVLYRERPESTEIQRELQWLYFNQLRERDLERHLETALERSPGDPAILLHLLRSSQRRPVAPEALPALESVDAAVPGQTAVELALARCYSRLGRADRANDVLKRIGLREPPDLEIALVQAEVCLEQGRAIDAEESLDLPPGPLAEAARGDDRWWWFKAQAAIQKKQWAPALAALENATRLRPGEAAYENARATVLKGLGRTEEAERARNMASELAKATRELYVLDSRGDVDHPTPEICRTIARHCQTLGKSRQAAGWEFLGQRLAASGPKEK